MSNQKSGTTLKRLRIFIIAFGLLVFSGFAEAQSHREFELTPTPLTVGGNVTAPGDRSGAAVLD